MQVLVRVLRASVWLSSSSLARQDGYLALVRAPAAAETKAQIAYGRPNHDTSKATSDGTSATHKRWATATLRWNDTLSSPSQSVSLVVSNEELCVDVALFELSHGRRDHPKLEQKIAFVATTRLQLSGKDLQAIDAAQEVVFKSPLAGDLGSVEVAVKRVDSLSAAAAREDENEGRGGSFSVQWTSSAALEQDLQSKQRTRAQAEDKLRERLVAVEARAGQVARLRDEAVELLRGRRAARAIQRGYRRVCAQRREQRRQRRRQQEQVAQDKKAALRAKVVARNHQRTQRLIHSWTQRDEDHVVSNLERRAALDEWVASETKSAYDRLQQTQCRLRAERDRKLEALESSTTNRSRNDPQQTQCRLRAERDRKLEALESSTTNRSRNDPQQPDVLISEGLIHAIQRLHLRK